MELKYPAHGGGRKEGKDRRQKKRIIERASNRNNKGKEEAMGTPQKKGSDLESRKFIMSVGSSIWLARKTIAQIQGVAALLIAQGEIKGDHVSPRDIANVGHLVWNLLQEIEDDLGTVDSEIADEQYRVGYIGYSEFVKRTNFDEEGLQPVVRPRIEKKETVRNGERA